MYEYPWFVLFQERNFTLFYCAIHFLPVLILNLSILNHFNKDFSSGLIDRNVFDFKLFQIRKKGREKDGLSNGGVPPVLCVIVKLTRVNVKFLRICYLHQEVTIIQI